MQNRKIGTGDNHIRGAFEAIRGDNNLRWLTLPASLMIRIQRAESKTLMGVQS